MILLTELLKKPKAIILSGAPGAGKSTIVGNIFNDFNLKILNIDDYFIKNLKSLNVSLDLKKADSEGRSKAGKAMADATKEYDKEFQNQIENKNNIVLDGTAASYKKTERIKNELENAGYDVLMVYVYSSLENALEKNEKRFERSKGSDRSLMPSIVLQTWLNVTKNFIPYLNLFSDKFVSTTLDKKIVDNKSIEDIINTYITPYQPTDVKPKTEKEKEDSLKKFENTKKEITDLLKKENVEEILQQTLTPEEARNKIKRFLSK
jgi:hypothetical protein